MQKQISSKKALYAIVLTIILTASIVGVTVASSPTYYKVITSGTYPSADTYTIFLDAGVCYAETAYGSIAFESTNPAAVFAGAINSMTSGSIKVNAGTYNIARLTADKTSTTLADRFPIFIEDGQAITVKGEAGVIMRLADGENMGLWYVESGGYLYLKDMELDGNYAGQTYTGEPSTQQDIYCVYHAGTTEGVEALKLENVWAHDATTDNIAVVNDGIFRIIDCKSTHPQYDTFIAGGEPENTGMTVYMDNWQSEDGWIEVRTACDLIINGAHMKGQGINSAVLSLSYGSPRLILNNFVVEDGRIQSDSPGYPTIEINNGKLITGRLVFIRCTGAISNIDQTGSPTENGLAIWVCNNLKVSNCAFRNNFNGIEIADLSGSSSSGLNFNGITVSDNVAAGFKVGDDCDVTINNFNGYGIAINYPVLYVSVGYNPVLQVTNYNIVFGRILNLGSGANWCLTNGRIETGQILFYNAIGNINGLTQTGTPAVNGIELNGCQNMTISGATLTGNYRGIQFASNGTHSTHNIVSNIVCYNNGMGSVVELDSNQNYNTITNVDGYGDLWYILTAGANTHVQSSWNKTTAIFP